ncbi:MAG: GNAT family N-acetyltransferase [Anaerolineales bacterium]
MPRSAPASDGPPQDIAGHLRPVHIRHDLAPITDLIELCFQDTIDNQGRAMLREMRAMAALGPLLWVFHGLDKALRGLMQGFVWEHDGRIVGNISLYPAGHDQRWVIANVAVHPEYRRQGIAAALCRAGLGRIQKLGGRGAILQVDAGNDGAVALYEDLGFHQQRAFGHWRWHGDRKPAAARDDAPRLTYLAYHERGPAYDLIQSARPDARGGIGWLHPAHRFRRRMSAWGLVMGFLSFDTRETFVLRDANRAPRALILTEARFGSSNLRFDLIAGPGVPAKHHADLLDFVLRRAQRGLRNAYTEHPADDETMRARLLERGFLHERTLIHMAQRFE